MQRETHTAQHMHIQIREEHWIHPSSLHAVYEVVTVFVILLKAIAPITICNADEH